MPISFDVVAVLLLEKMDVIVDSKLLDDDDELLELLDDELLSLLDDELLLFFKLLNTFVRLLWALTQVGAASINAAIAM